MNKQTKDAEQEVSEKNTDRNIPADAILMGEGSCSFKVVLFDKCEKAEKDEEN